MFEDSRAPSLIEYIRSASFPSGFAFEWAIINWTQTNSSSNHLWYPPDDYRSIIISNPYPRNHRDCDLASKFIFGLRLFLSESQADWFWRGTDDTVINFANLPKFVRLLNRRYNPRRDPVVLGHCISYPSGLSFIQGGSGWVISRRAAQMLSSMRDSWIAGINTSDDAAFARLLGQIGVSLFNTTSEFFLGHDLDRMHQGVVTHHDMPLPACRDPSGLPQRMCRQFTAPLSDLVFWHEQLRPNFDIRGTLELAKRVFALPRDVHFWMDGGDVHLCRAGRVPPDPFAV
jgi:hypothetical protein